MIQFFSVNSIIRRFYREEWAPWPGWIQENRPVREGFCFLPLDISVDIQNSFKNNALKGPRGAPFHMMGLIFYLHLVRAINGRAFEPSRLTKMMRKRPPGRPAPPWYQCWVRRGTAAFELFWTLKWEGARGWDGMSWFPISCFSSLKMHGEHCFFVILEGSKALPEIRWR